MDKQPKLSPQQRAPLRVCMSCEWIYKGAAHECPKCGWPSYGARFVFGNKAYRFAVTQTPWFNRKMSRYAETLEKEIRGETP